MLSRAGAGEIGPGPEARGFDLKRWSSLIRFSHTVFALPFALLSAVVATDGEPPWWRLGLVVLAMVAARSAAMAYNRYADRDIDAENPRTRGREIPSGALSPRAVLGFTGLCGLVFIGAAAGLGRLPGFLALPTLLFLLGYSHAKRFTALTQIWLGIALGLAVPAAWIAMEGPLGQELIHPCVLGLGVALWVAGFDAIYACQDEAFDRAASLHSLPSWLGRRGALRVAAGLHLVAIVLFAGFGWLRDFGPVWFVAVAVIATLLLRQQLLAHRSGGGAIDPATFAGNGAVGFVALFAGMFETFA